MSIQRKLLVCTLATGLALSAFPSQAFMAPATPAVAASPGAWAAGQTPANGSADKPVILFVHGLTSQAKVWYENNDMYEYAYNNGYQTAFINMYDISGTPEDMWKDGELLAAKIKEISQYFGKKIVIVAHSKGGVDTESALVRYNAYPYVNRVITLSTPHHGSQLADLAYSSWAGWLADLVGSQSPGTNSLQTSNMTYFRSEMAKDPDVNKVPFYTLSGNKWSGSGKSSYTFGGAYLALFGSNDGVVTTESALRPNSTLIQMGPWNHATVRTGSYTFDLFKSYIGNAGVRAAALSSASVGSSVYGDVYASPSSSLPTVDMSGSGLAASSQPSLQSTAAGSAASTNYGQYYVRGGEYKGTATETLTVEDHVKSITLDWITNQPIDELRLISPQGKVRHVQISTDRDEEIFKGAYHQVTELKNPEAGEWQVQAVSHQSGAYLMTAIYAPGTEKAHMNASFSGQSLDMTINTHGLDTEQTTLTSKVEYYDAQGKRIAPAAESHRSLSANSVEESLPVPDSGQASNYVITTDVEGKTATGAPYKRTLIKSVYVDAAGHTYSQQD
ncbi:esterase/lipase family protein [Paenibacillus dauci]|uniref:esterase/lipase family protein n=1 Tax=Paenibacillus dauci TaxID=1567106 RepID=UPI000619BC57|nr:hypothetical protein [Paenibacillus dauci]